MTVDSLISVRELDSRWTNGIQVRLLWCQCDGRLAVAVADTRSGESFRIDIHEGERPIDVFHIPLRTPPAAPSGTRSPRSKSAASAATQDPTRWNPRVSACAADAETGRPPPTGARHTDEDGDRTRAWIRVALAEDSRLILIREFLAEALATTPAVELIAVRSNGNEALSA
jgi:hypothetical protein